MSKEVHAPGAGMGAPARYANHVNRVFEGEQKAIHYLALPHAQQAGLDGLALIVSMMYRATPRGCYRVINKAIGGHGG